MIEKILTHLGLHAQAPPALSGTRDRAASHGLSPLPIIHPSLQTARQGKPGAGLCAPR